MMDKITSWLTNWFNTWFNMETAANLKMLILSWIKIDKLSLLAAISIALFSLLTLIYSLGFMRGRKGLLRYYLYVILTFLASLGAVFANNLIFFMAAWGFLGLLLYLLIDFGQKERTPATAKKTLIIIGGTDALMLLGIGFIWLLSGSLDIDKISLPLTSKEAVFAYLCLAAGALAKAGAMPFHTWVPDTAEDAPTPVTAFLPASLDKLLGIYFLARLSLQMFQMDTGMNNLLMFIGSFTIIAAVMMALIQHDLKRLLGYHAVSQVGYMLLGIGTGNIIGIAGGLFHMLNHAIYKSCLFFSGGAVEKKQGTTDLEHLGGLAKVMPLTFFSFLTASFAISGIPPLNGFASKWMVYQGVIKTAASGGKLWVVWLTAAMFGSALTLASFMKLIHAVFLGQPHQRSAGALKTEETGPSMWLPQLTLAVLCIVFGVAYFLPLNGFIFPALGKSAVFSGIWNAASSTTLLILASVIIGIIIYFLGSAAKTRQTSRFVGGEVLDNHPAMRLSGTEFYNTIQDIGILRFIYRLAKKKVFDIYEVGSQITFAFNKILSYIHNGVLSSYLAWCLLGMIILFKFLLQGS